MKGNYRRATHLALLGLLVVACQEQVPQGAAARRVLPAQAVKPDLMAAALRRLGGAHYHATLLMAAGRPGGTPVQVTTTSDVWLDRAGNFKIHEDNDRDGGRDVVLHGRELSVALRYGKMIRRVAEEPEPAHLLEQALGGPWAAYEIGGAHVKSDGGVEELVGGARATRYTLSFDPKDGKGATPPPHLYGLRAWRAGAAVTGATGRAVIDDATGALMALDLAVDFRAKRDGADEQGRVEVHAALSDVASTPAIARPAAEELVLRQRTVPEAKELLRGLAEPGSHHAPPAGKEHRP